MRLFWNAFLHSYLPKSKHFVKFSSELYSGITVIYILSAKRFEWVIANKTTITTRIKVVLSVETRCFWRSAPFRCLVSLPRRMYLGLETWIFVGWALSESCVGASWFTGLISSRLSIKRPLFAVVSSCGKFGPFSGSVSEWIFPGLFCMDSCCFSMFS